MRSLQKFLIAFAIFLSSILLGIPTCLAQPAFSQLRQITTADGLPNNMIFAILQDSQGFMWFGTRDGLARYDGRTFKIFQNDIYDSTSISDNWINLIYEDRFRRLWIGTHYGVNEFDPQTGKFRRYFPNPEHERRRRVNEITAICEDSSGALWVGVYAGTNIGGIFRLERESGTFIPYRQNPDNPNSLSDSRVRNIFADDGGDLWIGTQQNGLNRFDPKTENFTHYMPDPDNPTSLSSPQVWYSLKDSDGRLWFATPSLGICRYDPQIDGFIRYRHDSKNPNSLASNNAFAMYQDCRGFIWINNNGVLVQFDPRTEIFTRHAPFFGNTGTSGSSGPSAIYEDLSHNLWIGTETSGLFIFDHKPARFAHYQHRKDDPNSLPENDISTIYESRDGLLWLGTRKTGLIRFDPENETYDAFAIETDNKVYGNRVSAILEDRTGAIWTATNSGVLEINPKNLHYKNYRSKEQNDPHDPNNLAANFFRTMLEDQFGTIWAGSMSAGLNKADRVAGQLISYKPIPEATVLDWRNDVRAVGEDRFGHFWVTTHRQLLLFDRQSQQFTHVPDEAGIEDRFGSIVFESRDGTVWSNDSGLNRADAKSKTFRRFAYIPEVGPEKGVNMFGVYEIAEDRDGFMWCASLHGLVKFDPRQEKVIACYTIRDGLLSDIVYNLIIADDGKLWLLHPTGITIFAEDPAGGAPTGEILGVKAGVINSATANTRTAFIKTRSGDIFWGGANGLYRFYKEVGEHNRTVPPVQLTDFRIFNKAVASDTAISARKALSLKHDQNFFSFTFAALDFTNPKQNQYAYQLQGFDTDWVYSGVENEAHYTNVPPGEYVFRARGANSDGVWNEEGASVAVFIHPAFWQTWWFRTLVGLAIIGLLALAYRYRVSQLLALERTRLRISRDLHDDVGSSLSSIALTAELLQKELTSNRTASRQLRRVHDTAQKLTRTLKEIVWAIDPKRDRLDDLLLHIRKTADELLGQKGIAYDLHLPNAHLPKTLKMELRRNLFLIYKELLHNIVKHAKASHVEIGLQRSNGFLELRVSDDGIGFDPGKKNGGHGLENIRLRAAELGGEIAFEANHGAGTKARLRVKVG